MLKQVEVSNIALIEEATLALSPGLTVLSGETGTGKTALLFSLKLLIGERADSYMIRDGAETAYVEGIFDEGGSTLRVRRRLGSDGRSRCWIDDEPVTVAVLAQRVGPLVDLYGQHDHQSLLSPSSHMRFLDMWIGHEADVAREVYRSAYEAYSCAEKRYNDLIAASSATKRDLELAHFALREIEAVGTFEGEYEEIEQELPALQHADALASAANEAYEAIRNDGGVNDILADSLTALTRETGIDARLDDLADRLGVIVDESEELASDFRAYRDSLDFDPEVLVGKLERLHALDGIRKKYGPRMQDVFERERQARSTIELVDSSEEILDEAKEELARKDADLVSAASALATLRSDAALGFSDALTRAVASLGMQSSSFMLAISDLPRNAWNSDATQHIELLYCPGASMSPRPLAKIASGGELSRVMLALKGEVNVADNVTLVFDEIDSGIGGSTATLVANRLAELSSNHQVVVVTHLPQIAVCADTHLVVEKVFDGSVPRTTLREVTGEARTVEIARMLSGNEEGVSLEHARTLLKQVRVR